MTERTSKQLQQQIAANQKETPTNSSQLKSTRNMPKYHEGEKILCYHGAFIYEAKVL
jgi:hypothetical protein